MENLNASSSGSGFWVPDESDFDDDIDHLFISTLLPIPKSMFKAYYLLEWIVEGTNLSFLIM
jgi:hypothetical protein